MTTTNPPIIIASQNELATFLSLLSSSPILYMHIEGIQPMRPRSIPMITLLADPGEEVRIVDVAALGKATTRTASQDGKTLKAILEDADVTKCVWDVWEASKALWELFRVRLRGVVDLEEMYSATDISKETGHAALVPWARKHLQTPEMDLEHWLTNYRYVQCRVPFGLLEERPMKSETIRYCVNQVKHLPSLRTFLQQKQRHRNNDDRTAENVAARTLQRIKAAQNCSLAKSDGRGVDWAYGLDVVFQGITRSLRSGFVEVQLESEEEEDEEEYEMISLDDLKKL